MIYHPNPPVYPGDFTAGSMEPQYLKFLKKKKKSYKGLAIIIGTLSFGISYLFILTPVSHIQTKVCEAGILNCPSALFFSLLIGVTMMFCAWCFC